MRTLFFVLLASTALAQSKPQSGITASTSATAARIDLLGGAGSLALVISQDKYICFNGTTCTRWVNFNGNAIQFGDSGTAVEISRASGANALQFSTTGARFDLGAGTSDYIVSDGSEVAFASNIKLNTASVAKPTCNAGNRGKLWYAPGGAGVADTMEYCRKDAADAYAWTAL